MLLAIDIGNTCVDLGLFSIRPTAPTPSAGIAWQLKHHAKHPTNATSCDELQHLFASLPSTLVGAAIGSVVAGLADTYADLCRPLCQGPVIQLSGRSAWDLDINYDDPDHVGVDRLAAAAAARRLAPEGRAAIVADAGTAVTIDAIDANGTFLGGAIAPGLRLGLKALNSGTSLLPEIEPDPSAPLIGNTTADGLRSGALYGSAALVEGLCARMTVELGVPTTVFFTGGNAPILQPLVSGIDICDTALVLRGLAQAYSWYVS